MSSFGIPFINTVRQDDPSVPLPLLARPPLAASLMPQDAGAAPAGDIPRIGDHTPLGRFAQPIMPAPVMPQVTREQTPIEGEIGETKNQLQKLRTQDANPYGSANNHPGLGGKILHGLSVAGNIAGNFLDPNLMALTPGTQLYRQTHERDLESRLRDLDAVNTEDQLRGAQTSEANERVKEAPQKAEDEHGFSEAQTRHINDEADELENPSPNMQHFATDDGFFSFNPGTGEVKPLMLNGQPIKPTQKLSYSQPILGDDGKPHVFAMDSKGNKVKDEGVHYERPMSVNVNAGTGALDRETKQFGSSHQKALDGANAQLDKITEARNEINGNAASQALGIPKVLTALVSGAGTGVRITQAELNSIAHARGFSGDFQGTLNGWAGKGQLTKQQQQQLSSVLDGVRDRILAKQAIASGALDEINGAASREQIIGADKKARQNLNDLERYGKYAGMTLKLKNGQSVVVNHVHPDGSFD